MPDALELPRMLRAIVPLMRRERLARLRGGVIDELVAFALGHALGGRRRLPGRRAGLLPGFAAVVRTLDHLPKPTARLGGINAVGIGGRTLHVINLPTDEQRLGHGPLVALAVGTQDERSLPGANQDSYFAHDVLLLLVWFMRTYFLS